MKLSKKSEYACLALIELARNYNRGLVTVEDLSAHNHIPKKYLEQILLLLSRAGLVKSVRGSGGGNKLAKPPEMITVAEVIRLIDGPLAPVESVSRYFYEHTPIEQNRKLVSLFKDIRDYISAKLEDAKFSDLV